ncbi:MAG: dienelactone hydrolase family protein [Acidimicrobiia bacterium]|nr:dienelactone hydrolase family protein [Acidimicrobiia bacterium]
MSAIELPSGTQAFLARPPVGPEPSRGLVVIPDIMGLRPLFEDMCTRIATEQGWPVACPEPFHGHEALSLEERLVAAATLDDARQIWDVIEAADVTGQTRVGVIGFCMGGMYTLKASGTGRFDRAVSFYGMIHVPEMWHGPGQGDPLAEVRKHAAAVMAIIGEADEYTPPADVDELEAAGATVVRYAGAEHGFVHDPARPAHRPDDAADAWRRCIEFLE